MSANRVFAIVLRHWYQFKRDLSRISEVLWYPVIDLVIWGMVTSYLADQSEFTKGPLLFFLGGIILWVFVYRMQMGLSLSLMIDMWDRNFVNLFTSPLTTAEYITGLTLATLLKIFVTFFILSLVAFFLYTFNIFRIGWYLLPFILNLLIMGWWMGTIINGFILRFGYKIEMFAWGLVYIFNPLSGVFFPISVMPSSMRNIALMLPSTYIFEGMRQVMTRGVMDANLLLMSVLLNIIYTIVAIFSFLYLFRASLRSGMLVKLSE